MNEADGFEAYRDDLADEADDVFGIVGAIGIVNDAPPPQQPQKTPLLGAPVLRLSVET